MSPKKKPSPAKAEKPTAKSAGAKITKISKQVDALPSEEMDDSTKLMMAQQAEELEAQEEAQEEETALRAGGGNDAAIAAAASANEQSTSFKNFRHHPDMENFYRFIYENDLRFEALDIIDEMLLQKKTSKMVKTAKVLPH